MQEGVGDPNRLNSSVSEHLFMLATAQPAHWMERQREEGEYNPLWEPEGNFGWQADWLSRQESSTRKCVSDRQRADGKGGWGAEEGMAKTCRHAGSWRRYRHAKTKKTSCVFAPLWDSSTWASVTTMIIKSKGSSKATSWSSAVWLSGTDVLDFSHGRLRTCSGNDNK